MELKLNPLEQQALNQNATNFLEGCCVYLLNHIPVEDQVVRDAGYLQFSLKGKKSGLNAFLLLSLAVGKTLGSEGLKTYFGDNIKTRCDLCDKVKQEYSLYQMEKIPENFITKKEEQRTNPLTYQQATSYWKKEYGLVDLQIYSNSISYRRCDEYWVDVNNNFCVVKHWMGRLSRKLFSYLMLLSSLL